LRHIPIFIIKASLTYWPVLNDKFRTCSFSVDWEISLEKSSFLRLGRDDSPSSMKDNFDNESMPTEVTFLQKFIFRTDKSLHFPS
jgi:hypothetical protein